LRALIERFVPEGPVVVGLHHRAALGPAHRRTRPLSRSGAFQPRPFRQGQRPALAERDVAHPDSLGHAGVGLAFLTLSSPSERYYTVRSREHADRARPSSSAPAAAAADDRRAPRVRGRPRKKGRRLPTLARVAIDPATEWHALTVPLGYGRRTHRIEFASQRFPL